MKSKGKNEYLSKGGWVGITDKYWFTSIIPEQNKNLQIGFRYLNMENNINTFFRLSNNTIIDRLREKFPELSSNPSQKEVFLLLRQLRNKW